MSSDAREALNSPGVAELIIAMWCDGNDTMTIAERIREHLADAGEIDLPTPGEAEAFAHNLPGRLGARCALRQREARRVAAQHPANSGDQPHA